MAAACLSYVGTEPCLPLRIISSALKEGGWTSFWFVKTFLISSKRILPFWTEEDCMIELYPVFVDTVWNGTLCPQIVISGIFLEHMQCWLRAWRSWGLIFSLHTWVYPEFWNFVMILFTVDKLDDEIFKAFTRLCWQTLFWSCSTTCRCSVLQISEPLLL